MAEEDAASAVDAPFARRAFGRASASYDAAAVLQGEVRNLLLERLELTELEPRIVLDAGAGTGLGGQALKRRYPRSQVLAVDSAHGMLRAAAARSSWLRPLARVCADVGSLPLKDASVDLIFSNFMLPWGDPDRVFAEFRRVLAPRGLLTFTTLGPDTLRELRSACTRSWTCTISAMPWCGPASPNRCSMWNATRSSTPTCRTSPRISRPWAR
jgi:malonyl-CoA O-methyltransferase